MKLSTVLLTISLTACVVDPTPDATETTEPVATATSELGTAPTREHVTGDLYRYRYDLRVGTGPNSRIRIHRVVRELAPWVPRPTTAAIVLMHGDFATFRSNFDASSAGMATWLATRNVDVWGIDRRWTLAPVEADLSDFGAMGLVQELEDIAHALTFVRGVRLVTSGSADRVTLSGFSRGGALAYFYASREAARPAALRHVKGLVPLDVYVSLSPADEEQRAYFCGVAADEAAQLAAGEVDVSNALQIEIGQAALTAPDAPSPYAPYWPTNRDLLLWFAGQTYEAFTPTPTYHLNGPVLGADGLPTGLRYASETVVATWFASAPPHQSLRESVDTDALTCGDAPLPADVPLARIRVPLFLIAAAGGYGDRAVFSTTQVSSTDVSTLVIRRLPVADELEDFGHADLLYSPDAAALAWQPLLGWLRTH